MSAPAGLRIRGSVGPRDQTLYPAEDGALGLSLFGMVESALTRGRPAPAVFLISADTIDRFRLTEIKTQSPNGRQRMLAAMASLDGIECMAMLGAFRFRGKGPLHGAWVASAFIEWPDNRWWSVWQPIGPRGSLVGNAPQFRTALEGSPRPGGMGGWFSLARRAGLKLRIQRQAALVH
jgi:hypothetical protein